MGKENEHIDHLFRRLIMGYDDNKYLKRCGKDQNENIKSSYFV
jgi:hypothetical protein